MRKLTESKLPHKDMVIDANKLEDLLVKWLKKEHNRNENSTDLQIKVNSGSKLTEYHKLLEYIRKNAIKIIK